MKKRVSYNINVEVVSDFVRISKSNGFNMSQVVENMIRMWLKKQENDKYKSDSE